MLDRWGMARIPAGDLVATLLRKALRELTPPIIARLLRRSLGRPHPRAFPVDVSAMSPLLHLGCGPCVLPGWINLDTEQGIPGVVSWDLRRELPLRDQSIEAVYSEHFIEHLSLEDARRLLRECARVMKPGALIRLSTPDLAFLVEAYRASRLHEWQDVDWLPASAADLMNEGMRSWGHRYLHDEASLCRLLASAGFIEPTRVAWRQSRDARLQGLESRPFHGDLIVEAIRP